MNLRNSMTATIATFIALGVGASITACDRDKLSKNAQPTTTAATSPAPVTTNAPPEPSSTAGNLAGDSATTAKVKSAMLADPDVKGLQVNVDTMNGVVTLSGTVDTKAQADKAVQIATTTEGVKSVNNNLSAKS
jgi:hyperosmotically inducible periplasmic protein